MTSPITGCCLCGAIRYTVSAPVSRRPACHCTHCQKTSCTGSTVNAVIQSKDFALIQGKPRREAGEPLISAVPVPGKDSPKSDSKLKDLGMTKFVKTSDGSYERTVGNFGPKMIREPKK